LADVVLPASGFAEKDGCFVNTERRIQRVRKAIEPIGQSRPDSEIIIELANRLGYKMSYDHPSEILAEMASLAPIYAGVSYERLEGKGLQWPVPHKDHPGTQFLHENGRFTCGFGKFHAIEHQPPDEEPDAEYPYLLSTGRILYHYNMTTVGRSRWLTEFRPAEKAMVHPDDACKLGINDGDWVEVESRRSTVTAQAWVTDKVLPGMVWLSFHYPECPTNEVTNGAYDRVTKTYEYKVCAVQLRKRTQE
ncbi:MAG: fdhF 4, partial [Firmicutes bacterium]|nr:fdhF 4 [Bacillota bacterium]